MMETEIKIETRRGRGRPSLRDQAERRVDNDPNLAFCKAKIMGIDPSNKNHYRWVNTASAEEILAWANTPATE